MFKITSGKGFQMKFANGWTVSVQFGKGNYCDHYHATWSEEVDVSLGAKGSSTAEIAAWDSEGTWHDFGTDTVKGYCTPNEVSEFISMIAAK